MNNKKMETKYKLITWSLTGLLITTLYIILSQ
jgi:hypothetical protein